MFDRYCWTTLWFLVLQPNCFLFLVLWLPEILLFCLCWSLCSFSSWPMFCLISLYGTAELYNCQYFSFSLWKLPPSQPSEPCSSCTSCFLACLVLPLRESSTISGSCLTKPLCHCIFLVGGGVPSPSQTAYPCFCPAPSSSLPLTWIFLSGQTGLAVCL